jgi:hypothetical protein
VLLARLYTVEKEEAGGTRRGRGVEERERSYLCLLCYRHALGYKVRRADKPFIGPCLM